MSVVCGDASLEGILDAAGVCDARVILIATPDGLQTRHVLRIARELNPQIKTAARIAIPNVCIWNGQASIS
jgi:CPA2 family monovalent cation:H+ antiporter-2